jgi:hypothetical protein
MKSVEERKADKAAKEKKEQMKRSPGRRLYKRIALPRYACPPVFTEGDRLAIKKKAKQLADILRNNCPWQLLTYLKTELNVVDAPQSVTSPPQPATLTEPSPLEALLEELDSPTLPTISSRAPVRRITLRSYVRPRR